MSDDGVHSVYLVDHSECLRRRPRLRVNNKTRLTLTHKTNYAERGAVNVGLHAGDTIMMHHMFGDRLDGLPGGAEKDGLCATTRRGALRNTCWVTEGLPVSVFQTPAVTTGMASYSVRNIGMDACQNLSKKALYTSSYS